MFGRTPYEAWIRYVAPLRDALRCISLGRFVLRESPAGVRANTDHSVTLNNMNSVPLRSANNLSLVAGQIIRIDDRQPAYPPERYRVQRLSYVYGITIAMGNDEQELLTFHWSRDQSPSSSIPAGHLHVGRGLFAQTTTIRPGDFHNAHIPTGFVPFAAIVRFTIAELGVRPLTDNWDSILAVSESVAESA